MEAAKTSIRHLSRLLAIAEDMAKDGIALDAHEYRPLSFGSFSVEFASSDRIVLCHWNGKGSILSVSFAELTNHAHRAEWIHDANISVSANDVYSEIASEVLNMVSR